MNRQDRIAKGPPTQADYERIIDELATIRMDKVISYGEDRYKDPDPEHRLLITYSDIYRKFIRLKEQMLRREPSADGESLRDNLLDLANYALMGVQLLDEPKDLVYIEEPTHSFQVDQIAFASRDGGTLMTLLEQIFGTEGEWSHDMVTAEGQVWEKEGVTNQAQLAFNYSIVKGGMEFEVLESNQSTPYWLDKYLQVGPLPILSHLGIHVENLDREVRRLEELGYRIAQDVRTREHSNPKVPAHRRYRYVIFNTRERLGFDIKLIQRLTIEA